MPTATIALLFALVGIGYLLAWRGALKAGAGEALGDFVVSVAIPALLFRTLAKADFGGARPLALWGVYFGSVALTWTLAIRRGANDAPVLDRARADAVLTRQDELPRRRTRCL